MIISYLSSLHYITNSPIGKENVLYLKKSQTVKVKREKKTARVNEKNRGSYSKSGAKSISSFKNYKHLKSKIKHIELNFSFSFLIFNLLGFLKNILTEATGTFQNATLVFIFPLA